MKNILFSILLLCVFACSDDDRPQNPFLPNVTVNFQVNLNLPEFDRLEFPGGSAEIRTDGFGINGVYIRNLNNTTFVAFELTDPNHALESCSALSVSNEKATCDCSDGNVYNLITGQPEDSTLSYFLKAYRVQKQGNVLIVTN